MADKPTDTVDATKSLIANVHAMARAGKEANLSADKVKSLSSAITDLEKRAKSMSGSLTAAFREPLTALDELSKNGLHTGNDLHEAFSSIVSLFKDDAFKDISKYIGLAMDRFVELDSAAFAFRTSTKLSIDQMKDIEKITLRINQQYISIGVTIDDAYKSAAAIADIFQSSLLVTEEQVKTTALLSKNWGVTESNAAGFLQKMQSVGNLTEKQASGMAGLAAGAAKAAGVPLDKVMGDVASASEETHTMMRGNVREMTFAAIQARRMGVDLNKTAQSAKGLLNFSQSVNDEMEASVLLGKNLNLNYARQLSFQGDVAGAQREILNQVRSMGDFTKMNVFQQEALAKATGYSASELTKMLKNEEKLSELSVEKKQAYEDATEQLKKQTEETGEQMLQQVQMQSAMQQLSNVFKAFRQIAADILTPVVMIAVKILIPTLKVVLALFNFLLIPVKALSNALLKLWSDWKMDEKMKVVGEYLDGINVKIELWMQKLTPMAAQLLHINSIVQLTLNFFIGIVKFVGFIISPLSKITNVVAGVIGGISKYTDVVKGIITFIKGIFSGIMGIFSKITTFTSLFGKITIFSGILGGAAKFIPIAGQVLVAIQAIWGIVTRLMKGMNIFDALGETLFDIFVSPFKMLFELLMKIPGIGKIFQPILKLFPLIQSGIKGAMDYFKNITSKAWASIKDLFSGKDIFKNLTGLMWMFLKNFFIIPTLIVKAIVSIFPTIYESFVSMFTKIKDWISSVNIFEGIWDAMKSVSEGIYNAITYAFTKAIDFVKGLFNGGDGTTGMFSGLMTTLSGIGSFLKDTFVNALSAVSVIITNIASPFVSILGIVQKIGDFLIKNFLGGLISISNLLGAGGVLGTAFKYISKALGTEPTTSIPVERSKIKEDTSVATAIQETNRKLDQLISLMANGGIAVNLNGRKVSEQLAISSS